jgi:ethylmalonyl-CoA mutase
MLFMADLLNKKDRPWIIRTYSGHSSAGESNKLYKKNLAKGQTGLSVAFDLPTQTGYDADHILARGEVGKVGVPIGHIDDMCALFEDIPIEEMNTSMTINATAPWLLALYIAACERQGGDPKKLKGTTQNDILKEYLSRGTYAFPPEPSLKMTTDIIAYTYKNIPKWNPVNVCPYHLQEAGATPVQELAFGLANAVCILDAVKDSGQVPESDFMQAVGRISFFLDSGIRFIEEMCKTKAFTRMWKSICEERYGVTDDKLSRFRYGVQVNSLGLTEAQPENNIIRIIFELLGVTLAKDGRARAIQLPAWNEALGLPRPWDQQWSLRVQQILASETDLLEYQDIFDGSHVIEEKIASLREEALSLMSEIERLGGSVAAIESGFMKSLLVSSNAARFKAIEEGDQKLVGVNCFRETEDSPLAGEGKILEIDENAEKEQVKRLEAFRKKRCTADVQVALEGIKQAIKEGANIMPPSIRAAHAGVTTGEWTTALREVFGEYRAPTGVSGVSVNSKSEDTQKVRTKTADVEQRIGHKVRMLVGKPGLDGHSNGAEQIALKARDVGFEVIYQGIRLTPEEIVNTALQEDVDVIGISILSGSHIYLLQETMSLLKEKGLEKLPVIVGGIIPPKDEEKLLAMGVKKVFTPKDYEMNEIVSEILDLI